VGVRGATISAAAAVLTDPGLQYTLDANRIHYTLQANQLTYTLDRNKLSYTLER
jgi:hypothetical protein